MGKLLDVVNEFVEASQSRRVLAKIVDKRVDNITKDLDSIENAIDRDIKGVETAVYELPRRWVRNKLHEILRLW